MKYRKYYRMKYFVYEWFWKLWHMKLRWFYDQTIGRDKGPRYGICLSRPWWHLCCNGDAGGWRTTFCTHFDDYIHYNNRDTGKPMTWEEMCDEAGFIEENVQ